MSLTPGREKIGKMREDVLSILPFSFCCFGSDIASRTRRSALVVRRRAGTYELPGSRLCVASPWRVEDARKRADGAAPRPGHG